MAVITKRLRKSLSKHNIRRESAHDLLVLRGEKWMKGPLGCGVVLREFSAATSTGEIPDLLGWKYGHCIMVEVKASRGDFLGDKNKRHRKEYNKDNVLGSWRFYLTSPDIVRPDEIPDGWGLYEVHGRRILHITGAKLNSGLPPLRSNKDDELAIMYSALRRLEIHGVIDKVYSLRKNYGGEG